MKYSKSTGGFYSLKIHGNNIPTDAVELTSTEYNSLLEAQALGKFITADIRGYPTAIVPTKTLSDLRREKITELTIAHEAANVIDINGKIGNVNYHYNTSKNTVTEIARLALLTIYGVSLPNKIKDSDGVTIPMTGTLATRLYKQILTLQNTNSDNYISKVDAVNAATDAASIAAIVY